MQRIAQVLKSNGRDGELLLGFVGIAPEDIDTQEPVFIEFDGLPVPFYFESFTPRGNTRALVRLTGVHNLTDADELAGAAVYAEDDLYEDEEEDLTGWTVLDADGTKVGTVSAHEDIPGNPCIWVETGHGEVLVPLHEELVLDVDETAQALRMEIPEGLLNL
jgi:16S rRNA processing protein RimM